MARVNLPILPVGPSSVILCQGAVRMDLIVPAYLDHRIAPIRP